ncbi:MAG: DUF192 domain-containing protein [Candidatus Aureabacteria bacterium]|nr:DUF192 domain-containing protein [Candidatus Auribacterota bacterium]
MSEVSEKSSSINLCVELADTFLKRLVGLLGTKEFPYAEGLFFTNVTSIHTFFMKYPIDVVFLNKENQVCKVVDNIKPFRLVLGPFCSWSVLEMRAGAAGLAGIKKGTVMNFGEKQNG